MHFGLCNYLNNNKTFIHLLQFPPMILPGLILRILANGDFLFIYLLLFYGSSPNFPPLPSATQHDPRLPQLIPTLLSMSMGHLYLFFISPFLFFPPSSLFPMPSGLRQSVPCFHVSDSILHISLFCSLDSSYK